VPGVRVSAAVSRGPQDPFTIEQLVLAPPLKGQLRVRVVACGICHTDLVAKSMLPAEAGPVVLGHEAAGVVEELGEDVVGISVGDHVLLSYRSCGGCALCRVGANSYCEQFVALNSSFVRTDGSTALTQEDGAAVLGSFFGQSGFASQVLASSDNVVVVPKGVDLVTAAPLGCGIQTGAGAVLNVLRPEPGSHVVVYGAGSVGLAAVMAAAAAGVESVLAVDLVGARRDLAVKLGATAVIDPAEGDVTEAVKELTRGGATHALDTTGVPAVVAEGVKALRARGSLVAVGLGPADVALDVQDLITGGKTLRGCIEGDAVPQQFLPELLALHADGRLPLEELITTYPLADVNQAVADCVAGTTIKPVLVH
jgi:aryl-alcohol dehydrogenase